MNIVQFPICQAENLNLFNMLMALVLAVPVSIWVVLLIHWWIDGHVSPSIAIVGLALALFLLTIGVNPPHPFVQGAVSVIIVSTLVFFPIAYRFYEKHEHSVLDTERLQRAHLAYIQQPGNYSATFELACLLYERGLVGHAVAIAEKAFENLTDDPDIITNRSMKDIFARELQALRNWKSEIRKSHLRLIRCQKCKRLNQLHQVACIGCREPYLLQIAYDRVDSRKFLGRLIIGWTTVAAVLIAMPLLAFTPFGDVRTWAIFAVAGAAAIILIFTFRERPINA